MDDNQSALLRKYVSDSRVNMIEIKKMTQRALDLINKSVKKDHFYMIAGDVIDQLPEKIIELEKNLMITSSILDKVDSDNVKTIIKPDEITKVEELVDNVRINVPGTIVGSVESMRGNV